MAPSVAEKTAPVSTLEEVPVTVKEVKLEAPSKEDNGPLYPGYYPHFDVSGKWPPLELFEHTDSGLCADPVKPHLLANATTKTLSTYLGTEIHGVQHSQLSKEGLDELALLAAERKVLIFRDQDFKDIGYDRQIEIANHFGRIQRHPTSGNVPGYPEFHIVYRDAENDRIGEYRGLNRLSRTEWHSDISYEKQTPGTTLFWILEQPKNGGGDTQFLSQVEAYKRLSPAFRKRLEGLKAVHSAVYQAEFSRKRGGPVRREPVENEHPLIRVHPVTGEKALYINQGFTRRIVGYKEEESDNLLQFLFDHLAKGTDFHIRAHYEPGTVVVWDNRVTCHSATPDFEVTTERRHAVRLTPQAEVPVEAKADDV